MAWHATRGKVMLFGGAAGATPTLYNDLWEWDGSLWTQVQQVSQPPVVAPPHRATMAYDASRDVLVAFSAIGNPWPTHVAETWEWTAQTGWQSVGLGGSPTSSWVQAFDAARQRMVTFGCDGQFSQIQAWEREGAGSWAQRTAGTVPPNLPVMGTAVFDSRRNRILLLHFNGNVYAYSPTVPARYEHHGAACPGTLGPPVLAPATPWSLPWLGASLTASLTNLPLSMAFVTMGFSDTTFGPTPLPLDLGGFGMPGCFLHTAVDASVFVMGAGNVAQFSLPVPNQVSLRGAVFFQQAVAVDPFANPGGAVLTNSVRVVAGTK